MASNANEDEDVVAGCSASVALARQVWACTCATQDAASLLEVATAALTDARVAFGSLSDATRALAFFKHVVTLFFDDAHEAERGQGEREDAVWVFAAVCRAVLFKLAPGHGGIMTLERAEKALETLRQGSFVRQCVEMVTAKLTASTYRRRDEGDARAWMTRNVPHYRGGPPPSLVLVSDADLVMMDDEEEVLPRDAMLRAVISIVDNVDASAGDETGCDADVAGAIAAVIQCMLRVTGCGGDASGAVSADVRYVVDGFFKHVASQVAATVFADAAAAVDDEAVMGRTGGARGGGMSRTSDATSTSSSSSSSSKERRVIAALQMSASALCTNYRDMCRTGADTGAVMTLIELAMLSSSRTASTVIGFFFAMLYSGYTRRDRSDTGTTTQQQQQQQQQQRANNRPGARSATDGDARTLNRLLCLCASCRNTDGADHDLNGVDTGNRDGLTNAGCDAHSAEDAAVVIAASTDAVAVCIMARIIRRNLESGGEVAAMTVRCLNATLSLEYATRSGERTDAKLHKILCEVLRPGSDVWCAMLLAASASTTRLPSSRFEPTHAVAAGSATHITDNDDDNEDEDCMRALDVLVSVAQTRLSLCGGMPATMTRTRALVCSRPIMPVGILQAKKALELVSLHICQNIVSLATCTHMRTSRARRRLALLKLIFSRIACLSDFLTLTAIDALLDCSFLLSWYAQYRQQRLQQEIQRKRRRTNMQRGGGTDRDMGGALDGAATASDVGVCDLEILERFLPPTWLAALRDCDDCDAAMRVNTASRGNDTRCHGTIASMLAAACLPSMDVTIDKASGATRIRDRNGEAHAHFSEANMLTADGTDDDGSSARLLPTMTAELTNLLSTLVRLSLMRATGGDNREGEVMHDPRSAASSTDLIGEPQLVPRILMSLHSRMTSALGLCLSEYRTYQDILPKRPSMQSHIQSMRVVSLNPYVLAVLQVTAKDAPDEFAETQEAKNIIVMMLADIIGRCRFASHASVSLRQDASDIVVKAGGDGGGGHTRKRTRSDTKLVEDSIMIMRLLATLEWIPQHLSTIYIRLASISDTGVGRTTENFYDDDEGTGCDWRAHGALTAKEMQILLCCAWKCCQHLAIQPGVVSMNDDPASQFVEDIWRHEDWQSAVRAILIRRAGSESKDYGALFAMMPGLDD